MKSKFSLKTTRQTTISLSIFFISIILQGISKPAFGQWNKHIIDPNTKYTVLIEAHDIENDGNMDLFVTDEKAGNILFYEDNNNISWNSHKYKSGIN